MSFPGDPMSFFRWIVATDGLAHAVLDGHDSAGEYLAVCRYPVLADRYLVRRADCCADCVARLPTTARPARAS